MIDRTIQCPECDETIVITCDDFFVTCPNCGAEIELNSDDGEEVDE